MSTDVTPYPVRGAGRPGGRSARGRVTVAAALVGVLLGGVLVMQRTRAAFTAQADNPASSWAAGTVQISDDDQDSALFTVTDLLPGDSGEKCIRVDYTGTLPAAVRAYAGSASGDLAAYLSLDVQEASSGGNTGSFLSGCSGFAGSTVYTGTVADFAATAYDFDHGVGTFAPSGAGVHKVYRFAYTLDAATPGAKQGTSASITVTWEAQNT